jgi:site-specific recombinase XerD
LKSNSDISQIVNRALARAGIKAPSKGSHQLRHALATDILRQGLSLTEIGQMLRHRGVDAAKRYAGQGRNRPLAQHTEKDRSECKLALAR